MLKVQSIKEVQPVIAETLTSIGVEDMLVAFDIDMTITQPMHPAVYYPSIVKYINSYKAIVKTLPLEQREVPFMLTVDLPQRFVEKDTIKIIKGIQNKNIKMIALTASLTGAVCTYDRFEVVRYAKLQSLGVNFESSFNQYHDIKFSDNEPYRRNYPVFYKGILCSNGEQNMTSKGDVLVEFLKKVQYDPKVIIMLDDRRKNLEDINDSLDKYNPNTKFMSHCGMGITPSPLGEHFSII